ncbi:hypothetical protein JCM8097_000518 [Rhodosporidiobolus ruineniae]
MSGTADPYADVLAPQAQDWLAPRVVGPYIVGYIFALYLGGVFLQQCISYHLGGEFSTLPRRSTKQVLVALFVLNLAYSGLVFEEAYGLAGWTGAFAEAAMAVRAASFIPNRTVKSCFYVWMALLLINVVLWSSMACGLGFIITIRGSIYLPIFDWNNSMSVYLACAAAADTSISVALAFSLRSRIAGFNRHTDSVLEQLIWLALRTALFTTLLSIGGAVVAGVYNTVSFETSTINSPFWLPLPPLYGLAYLTTISSSRRAITTTLGGGGGGVVGPTPAQTVRGVAREAASPANKTGGDNKLDMKGREGEGGRLVPAAGEAGRPRRARKALVRPSTGASDRSSVYSQRGRPELGTGIRIQVETQVEVEDADEEVEEEVADEEGGIELRRVPNSTESQTVDPAYLCPPMKGQRRSLLAG